MRAPAGMLLFAAAAYLPLVGCRTEQGAGSVEIIELMGGGGGNKAAGGSGKARPETQARPQAVAPTAPAASASAAVPGHAKPADARPAVRGERRSEPPADAPGKMAAVSMRPDSDGRPPRAAPGLPSAEVQSAAMKAGDRARLPSPDDSTRSGPQGPRTGLPSPGEVSATRERPAGKLPLGVPDPKDAARTVASIPLSGKEVGAGPGKGGPASLGLPGLDSADMKARGAAAKIGMPGLSEAERRRTAGTPLGLGAGSDAKPRTEEVTKPIAVGAGTEAAGRTAPKVNRMDGPVDPKQADGSGETRRLPDGVSGKDPRAGRRLPTPFRLTDLFSGDAKTADRSDAAQKK